MRARVGGIVLTAVLAAAASSVGAPASAAPRPHVPAESQGRIVSVSPARVLDTRSAIGVSTRTAVPGGTSVVLHATGVGGVPASGVAAVVLDVVLVSPSTDAYLTAYAADAPRPLASAINAPARRIVNNLVLVPVSSTGDVRLYVSATAHLVADVAGYVAGSVAGTSAGGTASPGRVVPLPPARILDTRNATGVPGRSPVPGSSAVTVQVTGRGGVPGSGVAAVVLNVAAVSPSATAFVSAYPAGIARPLASSLNVVRGVTRANLVLVPVSAVGQVSLYTSATTHLIADVAGYVSGSPGSAPQGEGMAVPVNPYRLLDTRSAVGTSGSAPLPAGRTVEVQVTGRAGIPASGVGAVVLNLGAVTPSGAGYLTAYPSGVQPGTSTLDYDAGVTSAVLVLVPVSPQGTVSIATTRTTHVIADVAGYVAGPPDGAPYGLHVTAAHAHSVSLAWTKPGAAAATVLRRLPGPVAPTDPSGGDLVAHLPPGTTSYTDTAVQPGTTYAYALFAEGARPGSGTTTEATTPPLLEQVNDLQVVTTDVDADVSWQEPEDGIVGTDVLVRRPGVVAPSGPDDGTVVMRVAVSGGQLDHTFHDRALDPATTYTWALFGVNAAGDVGPGLTRTAATSPSPYGSVAGHVTDGQGRPLGGTRVAVATDTGVPVTTTSSADGSYRVDHLLPADRTVCASPTDATAGASPTGYGSACYGADGDGTPRRVAVAPGATTTVDVALPTGGAAGS